MNERSVKEEFEASADEVDAIFSSFTTLHSVYEQTFESLGKQLIELPDIYKQKVQNARKLFESMASSASDKQLEISSQLYSQALTLMMGNAESILRSMFEDLVVFNFRSIKLKDSAKVEFALSEVVNAKSDIQLGILLFDKLTNEQNPAEKLSFQNMKQMEGTLKGYFGICLSDRYTKALHEYWQIRHIIIHNQSIVDKRFIDNLKAAELDASQYKQGRKVKIAKEDYEACFALIVLMLDEIDHEIKRLGLTYPLIPF